MDNKKEAGYCELKIFYYMYSINNNGAYSFILRLSTCYGGESSNIACSSVIDENTFFST